MKIAIVGCGAVGSYYGARLGHSGQDVHFLLRSDFDVVRRNGVSIRSVDGDFHYQPGCANAPESIGPCDLVIIALKTTANDQLHSLVAPLVGTSTALLTLQNGLGNETLLARLFGTERVLGGLCFVCLNRLQPGVILHLAHGNIVMGEYQRLAQPRTHEIAGLIQNSGVNCKITDDLEATHWEKLVWNIPFNGLGVAAAAGYDAVIKGAVPPELQTGPCMESDKLLADPRWEQLVRELMLETIAAANALGFKVPTSVAEHQISRTRNMGTYKASTLLDFENGLPLELDSIFLEPFRQARAAGVAMPRLAALCEVLKELERRNAAKTRTA